jgi:hypothetical protein
MGPGSQRRVEDARGSVRERRSGGVAAPRQVLWRGASGPRGRAGRREGIRARTRRQSGPAVAAGAATIQARAP